MTPDRIREERLRATRCLDDIRVGVAVLLRKGWDAPRIQALGAPLSVIFRLGNPSSAIIRRQCACADLRHSTSQAVLFIRTATAWLPNNRQAFRGALHDARNIEGWKAAIGAEQFAALLAQDGEAA